MEFFGRGRSPRPGSSKRAQQLGPRVAHGARKLELGGVVALDDVAFQRAGVALGVEDGLEDDVVGHPGGPGAFDGDARRERAAGLDPAQEIGERDTLRGAVGAQRLRGGVVVREAESGFAVARSAADEQDLDVPPVLGRGQPRDRG